MDFKVIPKTTEQKTQFIYREKSSLCKPNFPKVLTKYKHYLWLTRTIKIIFDKYLNKQNNLIKEKLKSLNNFRQTVT